ncbi:VanZ family protein [Limosilactobacillus panis DSM 6035]|uniref:VanZ family protein n=2 Tax=Lactobacillaceae TaxID=33958 RepID=A0A0R1XBE9_9LACO|nr:VanZ family protein [Limosilactobacillus panis DSM 6035]
MALCLTPALLSVASAHKRLFYLWGVPYNIIPFQGLSHEFFLNVIMTVPWGVYLFLINHRQRLAGVILFSFLFSLFIELNQFILDLLVNLGRLADVDDLITNTAGGLIGFLVMTLLFRTQVHRLIQYFSLSKDKVW